MAIRKPKPAEVNGEPAGGLGNAGVLDCWPALVEFLTLSSYDDGTTRQLPTLMVFVEAGTWRLWLHDRDLARSAWSEAAELEVALEALDRGLKEDTLSWRRQPPRRRSGGG